MPEVTISDAEWQVMQVLWRLGETDRQGTAAADVIAELAGTCRLAGGPPGFDRAGPHVGAEKPAASSMAVCPVDAGLRAAGNADTARGAMEPVRVSGCRWHITERGSRHPTHRARDAGGH